MSDAEATGPGEQPVLDRLRQGDPAVITSVMRQNNRALWRIARSVLRNDADADEVLQEAYVRAFSSLADFEGRSALSTWLARIVMNEAMRRLGRSRPTSDLSVLDAEAETGRAPLVAAGPPTPEQEAARQEIRRAVERAIDALPGPFRTVFVMRVIEQMSIEETAAVLGIPAATVKTRLNRANQALRRRLGAEFGTVLGSAFPFAGVDCDRLTSSVLARVVGKGNRAPLTS